MVIKFQTFSDSILKNILAIVILCRELKVEELETVAETITQTVQTIAMQS